MKKLTLSLLFSITVKWAMACSCAHDNQNFFENIGLHHNVCLAEFVKMDYSLFNLGVETPTGYFVLVDVIQNMDSNVGDTVRVMGQNGISCSESIGFLKEGDMLFLALDKDYFNPQSEQVEDYPHGIYDLSGCGRHYLSIVDGQNNGLSVDQIKNEIHSVVTNVSDEKLKEQITVYPNPIQGRVRVSAEGLAIQGIKVYDLSCQLVLMQDRTNQPHVDLDLSNLRSGYYSVLVSTDMGITQYKVFKE